MAEEAESRVVDTLMVLNVGGVGCGHLVRLRKGGR